MKKYLLILLSQVAICQVAINSNNVIYAKEYSKELSLYKAKSYVISDILGNSTKVVKFEIDPLAATATGELTSLVYNCEELSKEGLILGFYGDYWNESGVVYQGFGFKNLPKEKALELLNKIEKAKTEFSSYLSDDTDNHNIYFSYEDLTVLIYKSGETRIRVFWKSFDAEWQDIAFKRTKRRFEKKVK
jgi:hypothetical protein